MGRGSEGGAGRGKATVIGRTERICLFQSIGSQELCLQDLLKVQ
jgi:hypothetical protein